MATSVEWCQQTKINRNYCLSECDADDTIGVVYLWAESLVMVWTVVHVTFNRNFPHIVTTADLPKYVKPEALMFRNFYTPKAYRHLNPHWTELYALHCTDLIEGPQCPASDVWLDMFCRLSVSRSSGTVVMGDTGVHFIHSILQQTKGPSCPHTCTP
jgi:hypothetical protein